MAGNDGGLQPLRDDFQFWIEWVPARVPGAGAGPPPLAADMGVPAAAAGAGTASSFGPRPSEMRARESGVSFVCQP